MSPRPTAVPPSSSRVHPGVGPSPSSCRWPRRSAPRAPHASWALTLLAGTALVLGLGADALADLPLRRAPGAAVVWGSASARQRTVVQQAVESELRTAGWPLLVVATEEQDRITTCFRSEAPWPCLAPLVSTQYLAQVMAIQVQREGNAQFRLTGQLAAATSGLVTLDFRYCGPCDEPALARSARALAGHLLAEGAVRNAATKIIVRTRPPGATIRLDGRMIDAPHNEIAASPGVHTVFLQLSGFRSELRTVHVEEGKSAQVDVAFVAEPAHLGPLAPDVRGRSLALADEEQREPAHPRDQRATLAARRSPRPTTTARRKLAWTLVVGGATSLLAGAVLWALDEDAAPDPTRRHREDLLDSAPAGVALCVGGAAMLAAGAWMWPARAGRTALADSPQCNAGCDAQAAQLPRGRRLWLVSWSSSF